MLLHRELGSHRQTIAVRGEGPADCHLAWGHLDDRRFLKHPAPEPPAQAVKQQDADGGGHSKIQIVYF